jgi:hypothetical protein
MLDILVRVPLTLGNGEKARITFPGKVSTEQAEINLGSGKFS